MTSIKIKNEFKDTELGKIPVDWDVKRLGDIGQVIIGLTYKPEDVSTYGTLVHRSSNIRNNKLVYEDNVFVSSQHFKRDLILQRNDILVCVRNGSRELIGKSALIKGRSIGETFGAFMSVFRTDTTPCLIFYLILSNIIQSQINQSLGATINQITNKTLNNFQIVLPKSHIEQKAIAKALSDTDELIEKLEQIVKKKKLIKEGAMQELLTGKKRLPEFNKALGYKDSELGRIPLDWEVKRLRNLVSIITAPVKLKKEQYLESGKIPVIDQGLTFIAGYTDEEISFFASDEYVIFGDHSEHIKYVDFPFVQGADGLKILKPVLDNVKYIYYTFQNFYKKELEYKRHWLKAKSTLIPLPPLPEQKAIAKALSDMDCEIESLENKLNKYKQIKQGMMQDLLTGKVRLVNANE